MSFILATLLTLQTPATSNGQAAYPVNEAITLASVRGVWEGVTPIGTVFLLDLRDPEAASLTEMFAEDAKAPNRFVLASVDVDAKHNFGASGVLVEDGKPTPAGIKLAGTGIASQGNGHLELKVSFLVGEHTRQELAVDFFREGYIRRVAENAAQSRKVIERIRKTDLRAVRKGIKESPPWVRGKKD
jgi:hypothetical protein